MTSRERLLAAVRRQAPDRIPRDLSWGLSPALTVEFRRRTGRDDPEAYFGADIRFVGIGSARAVENTSRQELFGRYFAEPPAEAHLNDWGWAQVPGTFHHFTRHVPSMTALTTEAEIRAYPYPDLAHPTRLPAMRQAIAAHHAAGVAVGAAMATTIFETAWHLRGMDQLFLDFSLAPGLAEALLDEITERRCLQARAFAEADADVLVLGDDVSMQTGMLMSPDTWCRWFRGRLARVIDAALAVQPDMPVFYHSDGNPSAIIPDLIEIGVTILNPLQPECVDAAWVKAEYGRYLALWGTIGTQTTMPFGTPADVRAEVRQRIETLGPEGLVLGPTHTLEPDVPWENLVALYEAIDEFGTL